MGECRTPLEGHAGDRPVSGPGSTPRVDSRALLAGGRVLLIEHRDEVYSLRVTRSGKLILTK